MGVRNKDPRTRIIPTPGQIEDPRSCHGRGTEGKGISYLASLRHRHPIVLIHVLLSFPKRHSLRPVPAFQANKMVVADGYSSDETVVKGELRLWLRVLMDVVASEGGPGIGGDEHRKIRRERPRLSSGAGIYASSVYIPFFFPSNFRPSYLAVWKTTSPHCYSWTVLLFSIAQAGGYALQPLRLLCLPLSVTPFLFPGLRGSEETVQ